MDRLEYTYTLDPEGRVRIAMSSADMEIVGGTGPEVRLVVIRRHSEVIVPEVFARPEEVMIASGANRAGEQHDSEEEKHKGDLGTVIRESILRSVRDGLRKSLSRISGEEADLELTIPRGATLEIHTASGDLRLGDWEGRLNHHASSGDVRIRQVKGEASIRTTSGGLEIERYQGKLKVGTTSGDVRLEEVEGDVRLETISGDAELECFKGSQEIQTVSGDLTLRRGEGEVAASTTSGDLSGDLRQCPRLKASTVSGDLRMELEPLSGGSYEVHTTSGDVRLRIPRDSKLEVRFATLSGDVSCRLPLRGEHASEETLSAEGVGLNWLEKGWVRVGHRFSGVLNAKEGLLEIKTLSGDITLDAL